MSLLTSADFLKVFLPLAGGVIAWLVNEHRKRVWEEYKRKEDRYIALLSALKGFYTSADPETANRLKQGFLDEIDTCWLYCPDNVIKKGYTFLSTVHTERIYSDREKEHALGEFILAIRRDLIGRRLFVMKRTALKPEDFKILMAT